MKVNVVAPLYEEWILTKFARVLKEFYPKEITLNNHADASADINYFINYALYEPVATKTAAWFTHPENNLFYEIANKVDWCICHAEQYTEELRQKGYKATTITPGIDDIFKPKLVVGVCGKKYDGKRKGADLLQNIKGLEWLEIKFTHSSWGGKDISFLDLPEWYQFLDYLLVPSSLEGGPIPVGEAIACGKKVIAPLEVGNVALFKKNIIPYEKDSPMDLANVLSDLYLEKKKIAKDVEKLTWKNFADNHFIIFNKICQLTKKY